MALDMTITCIDDHVQGIVPIVYVLTFWIQKVMFTVVIARQTNPRFNQTSIFSCLRSVFSVAIVKIQEVVKNTFFNLS